MTINITIQSQNEKLIKIINLNNFSSVGEVTSNNTTSLEYDNYLIEVFSTTSKFNINDILNVGTDIANDYLFIGFAVVVIFIIIGVYAWLKQNKY